MNEVSSDHFWCLQWLAQGVLFIALKYTETEAKEEEEGMEEEEEEEEEKNCEEGGEGRRGEG